MSKTIPQETTLESSVATAAESARGQEPRSFSPGQPLSQTPEYLLEVRLTVSAEIGRVQMPVRQVMLLGPGALIELQRSASEPVDILANGHCIARGEIVVIGEHFGVRVTELGTGVAPAR